LLFTVLDKSPWLKKSNSSWRWRGHQARFLRHPLLKQAIDRHAETLDNIYYDTAGLSLRRRGIALRLRRKGETGCKPSSWPAIHPPG
jgi:hypothetical protein